MNDLATLTIENEEKSSETSEHRFGFELVEHIKSNLKLPESIDNTDSKLACLYRISEYFKSIKYLNKGTLYHSNTVDPFLDLRLPLLANMQKNHQNLVEALWFKNYSVYKPSDDTEQARNIVAHVFSNGISKGLDFFGLGKIVNATQQTDYGIPVYQTLSEVQFQNLKPGSILEMWDSKEVAIDWVLSHSGQDVNSSNIGSVTIPERTNTVLIYMGRDENGLSFATHTGIQKAKSLSDYEAYDYIVAAEWYVLTAGGDLISLDESARRRERIEIEDQAERYRKLNGVLKYSSGIIKEDARDFAEKPENYGVRDFENSSEYKEDILFIKKQIIENTIKDSKEIVGATNEIIKKIKKAYIEGENAKYYRDDLAWYLNFLLLFMEAPAGKQYKGIHRFWAHDNYTSDQDEQIFISLYPDPHENGVPESKHDYYLFFTFYLVDQILESKHGNEIEGTPEERFWTVARRDHPIMSLINPRNANFETLVEKIWDMVASEPVSRRQKVEEFVNHRIDELNDAIEEIDQAIIGRSEDDWYLLLPLLYMVADKLFDSLRYKHLHEYAINVIINEDLVPEAGRDESKETLLEITLVISLVVLIAIPVIRELTIIPGTSAAASFAVTAATVETALASIDVILTSALAVRKLYLMEKYSSDADKLRKLSQIISLEKDIITSIDNNVFNIILPVLLSIAGAGLSYLGQRSAILARKYGVVDEGGAIISSQIEAIASAYANAEGKFFSTLTGRLHQNPFGDLEIFKYLVLMAYYKLRQGVLTLDQFLLSISEVGKIDTFSDEELESLIDAYTRAQNLANINPFDFTILSQVTQSHFNQAQLQEIVIQGRFLDMSDDTIGEFIETSASVKWNSDDALSFLSTALDKASVTKRIDEYGEAYNLSQNLDLNSNIANWSNDNQNIIDDIDIEGWRLINEAAKKQAENYKTAVNIGDIDKIDTAINTAKGNLTEQVFFTTDDYRGVLERARNLAASEGIPTGSVRLVRNVVDSAKAELTDGLLVSVINANPPIRIRILAVFESKSPSNWREIVDQFGKDFERFYGELGDIVIEGRTYSNLDEPIKREISVSYESTEWVAIIPPKKADGTLINVSSDLDHQLRFFGQREVTIYKHEFDDGMSREIMRHILDQF